MPLVCVVLGPQTGGTGSAGKRYLLTDKLIRRDVHTSVQALENDIRDWIATWNEPPPVYLDQDRRRDIELTRRLPR
jgi:hypothetical protein